MQHGQDTLHHQQVGYSHHSDPPLEGESLVTDGADAPFFFLPPTANYTPHPSFGEEKYVFDSSEGASATSSTYELAYPPVDVFVPVNNSTHYPTDHLEFPAHHSLDVYSSFIPGTSSISGDALIPAATRGIEYSSYP